MPARTQRRLRTGGFLWGHQRVALGLPMRELERRSGVGRSVLSYAEAGQMIPTADQYDAVTAVFREEEAKRRGVEASPPAAAAS